MKIRPYRWGVRFEHDPSTDNDPDPAGSGTATAPGDAGKQAEDWKRRTAELDRREADLEKDAESLRAITPYIDDEVRDLIQRKRAGQSARPPVPEPQGGRSAADYLGQIRDRAVQRGADRQTAEALVDEFGGLLNTVIGNLRNTHMAEMADLSRKFDSSLGTRLEPIESTGALDEYLAGDDEVVKGLVRSDLQRVRGEIAAFARTFAQKPKTPEQWNTVILAFLAPKLADGGIDYIRGQAELGERAGRVIPPGQAGSGRLEIPASRKREKGESKSWDKEMEHQAKRFGLKNLDHLNEVLLGQFRTYK